MAASVGIRHCNVHIKIPCLAATLQHKAVLQHPSFLAASFGIRLNCRALINPETLFQL
jgi:hypothetical protein